MVMMLPILVHMALVRSLVSVALPPISSRMMSMCFPASLSMIMLVLGLVLTLELSMPLLTPFAVVPFFFTSSVSSPAPLTMVMVMGPTVIAGAVFPLFSAYPRPFGRRTSDTTTVGYSRMT